MIWPQRDKPITAGSGLFSSAVTLVLGFAFQLGTSLVRSFKAGLSEKAGLPGAIMRLPAGLIAQKGWAGAGQVRRRAY
jgi:hypothetical protein